MNQRWYYSYSQEVYIQIIIFAILLMQKDQNQQIVCVRHHLPQPNKILDSQIIPSQPPKNLYGKALDFEASYSTNCKLQKRKQSKSINTKQSYQKSLTQSYGNNINHLITQTNKIVFISHTARQMYKMEQNNKDLGVISTQNISKDTIQKKEPIPNNSQLQFSDSFECSNIFLALKHQKGTYLLVNRLDYNTCSYGQWFYFKVKNITQNEGYFTFVIINMTKSYSMFGEGLKISVCRNRVWSKEGVSISYSPNNFCRNNKNYLTNYFNSNYYSLTFTIKIRSNQQVYCAYNQPYTYTRLGRVLDSKFFSLSSKFKHFKRSIICRTALNNPIEMISLAMPNDIKDKKVILLMGRSHPIQTAGSFVIQGIIQQLFNFPLTKSIMQLLENYVIKIIPMINPDGVIVGNSRCNIRGYDLNRRWNCPSFEQTPQIYHILKIIQKIKDKIVMIIDLHAHSKKKNVFAYGCHDNLNPFASRQFPFLLSKINQEDFLFSECRFSIPQRNQEKGGTARLALYKKLKIHNIFTIQNSYCSAEGSQFHYDQSSYKIIGKSIIDALGLYFTQSKETKKQNIIKQLRENKQLISLGLGSQESSQSQTEYRINQINTSKKVSNFKMINKINKIETIEKKNSSKKCIRSATKLTEMSTEKIQKIKIVQQKTKNANKTQTNVNPIKKSISNIAFKTSNQHHQRYLLPIKKINRYYFNKRQKAQEAPQSNINGVQFIKKIVSQLKITNKKHSPPAGYLSIIDIGADNFSLPNKQTYTHRIPAAISKKQSKLRIKTQDQYIDSFMEMKKKHYQMQKNYIAKITQRFSND